MADYWLLAYVVACSVLLCRGLPFANEQPIDIKDPAVQIGVDYLQRYDYLPPIGGSGAISKKEFKKSLKQMQKFSGLKASGKLDNETLTLMGTTRCGVPDPIKVAENGQVKRSGGKLSVRVARSAFAGGKWKSNKITYRIVNFTPDIPVVQTQNAIERAFQVWSDVTPLTFRRLDTGSADIYLRFDSDAAHGDGYRFDGKGGIFGHAFPPENALRSLDGDVHFDDDEDFTFQTTAGINLFQVAAHLIGHSLGLAHSSDPEALMAPFYKNFIPQFQLPLDDTEGIQRIYGVKPIDQVENSPAETTEDEAESSRPCNRVYDAVGFLRGDIFMFKNDRYWRLYFIGVSTSDIIQGDPINRFWSGLPKSVDATYERLDSTILFFKGSRYWEYKSNEAKPGYPKPISDLSPDLPDRIDAALTWPDYGKTYFFRRNQVWRFDEKRREVDNAYPKLINETWKGVPDNIDSAFSYRNGCTYFVKGKEYYRYNNRRQFVENGFPRSFGVDFLMCRAVDD
ncbi:72 kDa type IV collagenase-like [Anneissia japonica]|uniref:72 kDa type IV collagenase-like n=1 Tax=Anneissia japonica TaxID=1529436 RepID=UPI001425696A|nr:72 kDa type IV collagenase-like [Anneissia japonica]